jgi:hypothetical protein
MAGNILQKEQAIVSLETNGASQANNVQAAATTTLDCRAAGNAADMFFADFDLTVGFGSSPVAGVAINAYLVPAMDGTNYADVDTTNHVMPPACFIGSFLVNKAQTAVQKLPISGVSLRPLLYKLYLDNQTAQTMSTGWLLKVIASEDQYT